jgi:predicted GNAT family N-acyltransferase
MRLEVRRLEPDQLSDVYKLRYEIFFDELGALLPADEIRRGYLSDPLDHAGYNYGLYDGDSIVGSLRVVDMARVSEPEEFERKFSLAPVVARFGRESICFAGRLTLAPSCRSGTALARLVLAAYEDGRRRGLRVALSDCSPYLLPLYAKLGYRRFGEAFTDPIYGLKLPILLLLEETARFKLIKSPFAKASAQLSGDDSIADWFNEVYPEYRLTSGNLTAFEANLPDLAGGALGGEPLQGQSLFDGFTKAEMGALLNGAVLLDARPGNYLVRKGLREKHLYFILDGLVESCNENSTTATTYGKGEFFAGDGLLVNYRRTADVVARTRVKCLLINGATIAKVAHLQPQSYVKLMRNLGRALGLTLQSGAPRSYHLASGNAASHEPSMKR